VRLFQLVSLATLASLFSVSGIPQELKTPKNATGKRLSQESKVSAKRGRAKISLEGQIQVIFANKLWNTSSTEINTGTLVLRDAITKRVVKIQLQESEPDSSEFHGKFTVNWEGTTQMVPGFYGQKNEGAGYKEEDIPQLIKSGQLVRLPYVLEKDPRGPYTFYVFTDREQTIKAAKTIEERARAAKPSIIAPTSSKAALAVLEVNQLKQLQELKFKLSEDAIKREKERLLRYEKALQERSKNSQELSRLPEGQRNLRTKEAERLAQEGMRQFQAGDFKQATQSFKKSLELNPNGQGIYYSYGVSLYREGEYDESIVALRMSQNDLVDRQVLEKDFYLALNYFRLREYAFAQKAFEELRGKKDPALSPSSAFYLGLIGYETAEYESAKPYFQEVLDTSEDSQLDEQAERMIDQINAILQFAKLKEKRFVLDLTLGISYDSNVLLVSDSNPDQASPSDLAGTRLAGGAGLYWRPIFEKDYEWGLKAKLDYIYSLQSRLSQADPFLVNVSSPFSWRGKLFQKGYKLSVKPAYENLYLDADQSGSREHLLSSLMADWGNTFVMSESWFSSYNFKIRQDRFTTDATKVQNANKYTLNLNNIVFLGSKKNRGLISDLNYIENKAETTTWMFRRYDIGLSYLTPLMENYQGVVGFVYYNANYYENTQGRNDTNWTALAIVTKKLSEWLEGGLSATYIRNQSTVPTFTYSKYIIGINFSTSTAF